MIFQLSVNCKDLIFDTYYNSGAFNCKPINVLVDPENGLKLGKLR